MENPQITFNVFNSLPGTVKASPDRKPSARRSRTKSLARANNPYTITSNDVRAGRTSTSSQPNLNALNTVTV
jgi:hypothetical protein